MGGGRAVEPRDKVTAGGIRVVRVPKPREILALHRQVQVKRREKMREDGAETPHLSIDGKMSRGNGKGARSRDPWTVICPGVEEQPGGAVAWAKGADH